MYRAEVSVPSAATRGLLTLIYSSLMLSSIRVMLQTEFQKIVKKITCLDN